MSFGNKTRAKGVLAMKQFKRLSSVSLVVLAGFHASAAMAQTAEQSSGGIDEIVVTAEKRET
jgi:hypothetical protein